MHAILAFVLAYIVTTGVLVYLLNLPGWISQQPELVHEYYVKNFNKSFVFDFFLVAIYFLAAYGAMKLLGTTTNLGELMTLVLVTLIISGGWYLYFTSRPKSSQFFSRWFHEAGVSTVVYDIVLLSIMYIVFKQLLG